MLVLSYLIYDIIFCELLVISEAISYYGSQPFALHNPMASLPIYLITCSSPHRTSKVGDILHLPRHFLLTLGADSTSHGLMFNAKIYQFIGCSSHGSNSQAHFLSHQLISAALHGSSFHPAAVYIPDSVGHIILYLKRNIPPDISTLFGFIGSPAQKNQDNTFVAA